CFFWCSVSQGVIDGAGRVISRRGRRVVKLLSFRSSKISLNAVTRDGALWLVGARRSDDRTPGSDSTEEASKSPSKVLSRHGKPNVRDLKNLFVIPRFFLRTTKKRGMLELVFSICRIEMWLEFKPEALEF
ncbi:hypothetical protein TNCV_1046061, partial [Trichonephila clavipes]